MPDRRCKHVKADEIVDQMRADGATPDEIRKSLNGKQGYINSKVNQAVVESGEPCQQYLNFEGIFFTNSRFFILSDELVRNFNSCVFYRADQEIRSSPLLYVEHLLIILLKSVEKGLNCNNFDGYGFLAKVTTGHISLLYNTAADIVSFTSISNRSALLLQY